VAQVGNRIFLNNISFGLYADIISRPEYRNSKAAVTEQTLRALAGSERSTYPLHFKDAHGARQEEAAQVLVGVNRYETVKLLELGERKRLDGGLLHVIVVPELSQNPMANLRKTEWTATSFKVSDPSGWVKAGIDGESVRLRSPVTVRIRPKALRLLVPAEGVRTRPIKPMSREAAQTLWALMTR
jgi:diacylglycerol kinase family enzyme